MISKIRDWFKTRTAIEQHRCSRPGWLPTNHGEQWSCYCGRKWVAERFGPGDLEEVRLEWVPSLSKI